MRESYDVRVYLDPPESLRRQWKVDRDCTKRGYTTDEVLADLDRREPDSAAFIRPQHRHADMASCRMESEADRFILDAKLTLRDTLQYPRPDALRRGERRRDHADRERRREHPLDPLGALPRAAALRRFSRRTSGASL